MESLRKVDRKWLVLIAIGASTFMSALDTSVVNIVLPVIRSDFDSQIAAVEWVVTIYLLVVSGCLLSFGRLGDLRGHKSVFLFGFGIFITSSALCGFAPSTGALITFRGLQALGAAMLAANSPAILTKNFPSSQRGQALGLQATMTYLGLTVAPSFGGWLTSIISWRAVFYINVPVGLLAFLLSWKFIPTENISKHNEPFDWAGALLFISGLVSLLLVLNQGHAWGWTTPGLLSLLAAAVVFLAIFLRVENRHPFPILDLDLFRNTVFSASVASAVFNYMALFSLLFVMPFYLLQGRGFDPAQAGLIMTAQPVVMALIAPVSGTLSDRIGVQTPGVVGMSILALGLFALTRIGPDTSPGAIIAALSIVGLGTGTFISPNNSALMGSAPSHRQGIAAGILATARSGGMVLGVGLSGAIFNTILVHSISDLPLINATRSSLLVAGGIAVAGVITSAVRGTPGSRRAKSNVVS